MVPEMIDSGPARTPSRLHQCIEVAVFLLLIMPAMGISLSDLQREKIGFMSAALSTMLHDLGLVSLIFFFLWRNGEPYSCIGWTTKQAVEEAALGIGLFIPFFVVGSLLAGFLQAAGFPAPPQHQPSFLTPKGPAEFVLASIFVVFIAVAEETIFRGYLYLRFNAVTKNRAVAVLLATFLFALGHRYEGVAGMITVSAMGLIFACIYLWRRSLIAPAVMHMLQDLIGIILIPLLKSNP